MIRRNLVLSVAFLLVSATTVSARQLTPSEALARVNKPMLRTMATSGSGSDMTLKYTEKSGSQPTVYLFAPASGDGGYMLVSADDVTSKALLGYTDKGTFDENTMPPGLKWLLSTYSREIASASAAASTVSAMAVNEAGEDLTDTRTPIEPLLTTEWGQTAPFNDYCPEISGTHAPVGCVALALAQCMKKIKWPLKGQGSTSYSSSYGGTRHELSMNFDTVQFKWDNMLDNYRSGYTAEQGASVASLCYALGVGVHMQYNLNGSGGDYLTASTALIKYFDYAESVCYYERDYFELEKWIDIIYSELSKGYAVPYSGISETDGHAFVADGYRTGGYFHINWGWFGNANGWFLLSALDPGAERLGDTSGGFNQSQSIIVNMRPSSEYVEPAVELRVSGDFSAQQKRYTRGASTNVTFHGENGIFSMAYATATVTLGVRLEDEAGNVRYAAGDNTTTFSHFQARQNYTVPASAFPVAGTYNVTPAFRDAEGNWHDILIPLSKVRAISLVATSRLLVFGTSDERPNLTVEAPELQSTLMIGERFAVETTFTNVGTEFYDEVWPVLLRNDTIVAHGPGMEVDVLKDETLKHQWVGLLTPMSGKTLTPGTYQLGVAHSEDYRYALISPTTEVQLRARNQAPLFYSCTPVSVNGTDGSISTESSPIGLDAETAELSFTLSCTQGFFGQDVGVYVFTLDNTSYPAYTFGNEFVGIDSDQSKQVTVTANLSNVAAGTVYMASPWASTSGRLSDTPAYFRIGVTGLEAVETVPAHLYPNPAEDYTTVRSGSGIKAVDVYSLSGQRMAAGVELTGGDTATLRVGLLPSGMYLVSVLDADSHRHVVKMIKR